MRGSCPPNVKTAPPTRGESGVVRGASPPWALEGPAPMPAEAATQAKQRRVGPLLSWFALKCERRRSPHWLQDTGGGFPPKDGGRCWPASALGPEPEPEPGPEPGPEALMSVGMQVLGR